MTSETVLAAASLVAIPASMLAVDPNASLTGANPAWVGTTLLSGVIGWILFKLFPERERREAEDRAEFRRLISELAEKGDRALREQRMELLASVREERELFNRVIEKVPRCAYLTESADSP